MTLRANWHLDVAFDDSDPFTDPPADPQAEGERVELGDPGALVARLRELLAREEQLGLSCAIKDRPDSCCSACPLHGSLKAHPIRELCKLGREQERALMAYVAADA